MSEISDEDPNRLVYETFYTEEHLRIDRLRSAYDREMVAIRFAYLNQLAPDRDLVDLGCGSGAYLIPIASIARNAWGVDFSGPLLRAAERYARQRSVVPRLVTADIRSLPLRSASFDVAYSIAALYYVQGVERAIAEMARIVRPRGRLLLELGNFWSVNTLVTRDTPSGVRSHHVPVSQMFRMLRDNNLRVDDHRAFQILPMYGGPRYLWPLVTPRWKPLMAMKIAGRMLDERVSSLPLVRLLAFRHLFLCTRVR